MKSEIHWFGKWIAPPKDVATYLPMILPLVFSQVLQRLFHVVDNRFVAELGPAALLIHNVQYNLIVLGQFLGVAGSTTALVLWGRKENACRKRSLMNRILILTGCVAISLAIPIFFSSGRLLTHFSIPEELLPLAKTYICLGLLNMVLQAFFGCLDGVFIACGQQKKSFLIAGVLVAGNLIADYCSIYLFRKHGSFDAALLAVGISTTVLIGSVLAVSRSLLRRYAHGAEVMLYRKIREVWAGELGIVLIRSVSPIIYAFFLAQALAVESLVVSYNLALHLAYLACLPLAAGVQLAVRDSSRDLSEGKKGTSPPVWWNDFFYIGLLPTMTMLLLLSILPGWHITKVYGVEVSNQHVIFLTAFFSSCMLGQLGHVFSIRIRANKMSQLVTRNFLVSELCIHIGLVWFLTASGRASPRNLGLASLAYTFSYLILNVVAFYSLRPCNNTCAESQSRAKGATI
jgi:Na+-driven multidrug efflux pump